jgi:hypothetical protein
MLYSAVYRVMHAPAVKHAATIACYTMLSSSVLYLHSILVLHNIVVTRHVTHHTVLQSVCLHIYSVAHQCLLSPYTVVAIHICYCMTCACTG